MKLTAREKDIKRSLTPRRRKKREPVVVLMDAILPMAEAALVWSTLPLRFRKDYLAGFGAHGFAEPTRSILRKFFGDMHKALSTRKRAR